MTLKTMRLKAQEQVQEEWQVAQERKGNPKGSKDAKGYGKPRTNDDGETDEDGGASGGRAKGKTKPWLCGS